MRTKITNLDISIESAPTGYVLTASGGGAHFLPPLAASGGVSDHGALIGLGDDDHSQYHTDARGDARYYTETELDAGQLDNRYFTESEHIGTSTGAGDSGKPVILDAGGDIDSSMINDADIDHANLTNTHNLTTDIDHDQLTNTHNLTTDIDHNQLTNYESSEHIVWSVSGVELINKFRIPVSGVTRHESSLTITESQISDLSHYTSTDFDTDFSGKSTTNLSEGTNLYFTDERVDDRVNNLLVAGDNITLSYDDGLNSLTITASGSGLQLTEEEVQDYAWNVLTGTQTLITVTYDDNNNEVDFVLQEANIDHDNLTNTHNLTTDINHNTITNTHNLTTDIDHDTLTNTHNLTTDIDHDTLTGFEPNEHIDWTVSGIDTLHVSRITVSGVIQHQDSIDHDQLTNFTATEHFTEGSIDHTAIQNIGSNTHAQIDTHISDGTIHFTEASIDHGTISGLGDDDHSQYFLLAGETTDAQLYSGADLIIYSDAGTTEVARVDGATGNITTIGTVDGVDIADHSARHESGGADEVNHDNLAGFSSSEHIDWSVTGAEDIHVDRITISGVTQHEASLNITESQISDLAHQITVRKNTGADVGTRSRLNLIEGPNVTITTTDDSGNDEIDITIEATTSGGSGSPGGSDTELQYNDGGAFGGASAITYNDGTGLLTTASGITNTGGDITTENDIILQAGNSSEVGFHSDGLGSNMFTITANDLSGSSSSIYTDPLTTGGSMTTSWGTRTTGGTNPNVGTMTFSISEGTADADAYYQLDVGDDFGAVVLGNRFYMDKGITRFNVVGNDIDFRIGGDTDADLFYVDAGTDRVGISTNAPSVLFDVAGDSRFGGDATITGTLIFGGDNDINTSGGNLTLSPAGKLILTSSDILPEVVVNEAGGGVDFRVEGDTEVNLLFTDASTDRVGIGTNAPDKLLDVAGDTIINGLLTITEETSPISSPPTGEVLIWASTDGELWSRSDGGLKRPLVGAMPILSAYNNSAQSINTGADINWGIQYYELTDHASLGSTNTDELTIHTAGWYKFHVDVSTEVTSGTGRSTSIAYITNNNSEILGSRTHMYNRQSGAGRNTGSISIIRQLSTNDVIRVHATRQDGSDTVETIVYSCRLVVEFVRET